MLTLAWLRMIRLTTRRTDGAGLERPSSSLTPSSPGFRCRLRGASSTSGRARLASSLAWDGDARYRLRWIFSLGSHIPILWLGVRELPSATDSVLGGDRRSSSLPLLVRSLDMSAYISEAGTDTEGRAVSARKVHVWQVVLAQEGPERLPKFGREVAGFNTVDKRHCNKVV
jgi:hypothetical protein